MKNVILVIIISGLDELRRADEVFDIFILQKNRTRLIIHERRYRCLIWFGVCDYTPRTHGGVNG